MRLRFACLKVYQRPFIRRAPSLFRSCFLWLGGIFSFMYGFSCFVVCLQATCFISTSHRGLWIFFFSFFFLFSLFFGLSFIHKCRMQLCIRARQPTTKQPKSLTPPRRSSLFRISQHHNDRVASQKHFRDESILAHRRSLLLSLASLWYLCPCLSNSLQHHVAVTIKGLDAGQNLAVVAAIDEHLCVVLYSIRQQFERSSGKSFLFRLRVCVRA